VLGGSLIVRSEEEKIADANQVAESSLRKDLIQRGNDLSLVKHFDKLGIASSIKPAIVPQA
jgi:hypothetical protein